MTMKRWMAAVTLVTQVAWSGWVAPAAAQNFASAELTRKEEATTELARIDERLAVLESERAIGWPIAVMTTGYVVGGGLILSAVTIAVITRGSELEGFDTVAGAVGVSAIVGLAAGIGGNVWYVRRSQKRRDSEPEVLALRYRRARIVASPQVAPTSFGLSVAGRF